MKKLQKKNLEILIETKKAPKNPPRGYDKEHPAIELKLKVLNPV
jgi:hypothetical protein